jgi:beta-lactamase superfamily II metal-dependent hydrolase
MSERQATVRMYNVGFGDCFLLTLPALDRPRKVLIDCGSHSHGPGPVPLRDVAARVIEDVREEDGTPRIDVVVATHRHRDHVSGFASPLWEEVEVKEVWLPWTEDPKDPEARRILDKQSRVAKRLQASALALDPRDRRRNPTLAVVENSVTNPAAMATLHRGFAGEPRRCFLPQRDRQERTFTVSALPGVRVHALGPSRDPEVIRDMDPPGNERYLRPAGPTRPGSKDQGEGVSPFASRWSIPVDDVRNDPSLQHLVPAESKDLQKIQDFGRIFGREAFELVAQLEKAVNGTSLVLVFEVGHACLLFPGDAQWGTWRAALDDAEWRDLLARTTFLKIGHHGSYNATPKSLVEALQDGLAAMVSTKTLSTWPDIPRLPLLAEVGKKSTRGLVRSDEPPEVLPASFRRVDDLCVELTVPV